MHLSLISTTTNECSPILSPILNHKLASPLTLSFSPLIPQASNPHFLTTADFTYQTYSRPRINQAPNHVSPHISIDKHPRR